MAAWIICGRCKRRGSSLEIETYQYVKRGDQPTRHIWLCRPCWQSFQAWTEKPGAFGEEYGDDPP